jgi:hypothetical protein
MQSYRPSSRRNICGMCADDGSRLRAVPATQKPAKHSALCGKFAPAVHMSSITGPDRWHELAAIDVLPLARNRNLCGIGTFKRGASPLLRIYSNDREKIHLPSRVPIRHLGVAEIENGSSAIHEFPVAAIHDSVHAPRFRDRACRLEQTFSLRFSAIRATLVSP